MAYLDPNISGARVRLRRSFTAAEAPATSELRPGEPAINAADGVMYVGKDDGTAGVIPGAEGFVKIVSMTQSAYDAITPASDTRHALHHHVLRERL